MNRFQIPSPILDLQTNSLNNFFHEYATTMIPFEMLTTTQVPEAETHKTSEEVMIIYGIGGILIFLVVCTICYRCVMPDISDAAYTRFMRRNRENLQERMRLANLERQGSQNDVENPVTPENPPVSEIPSRTETISEADRRRRDVPRNEQSPISGVFGTLTTAIRSRTIPKQVCDSRQDTYRKTESRNTTAGELQEPSNFPISEKYEERVPSWVYFPDNLSRVTESTVADDIPCEKDSGSIANSQNSATGSPVQEGGSQSSPTSPNIVRRRYPSLEVTPRRSSSLR